MEEQEVLFWEDPALDLNLRHYSGSPSDVIKKIQKDIKKYLSNPNLQEVRTKSTWVKKKVNGETVLVRKEITYNVREIYSAIYHALTYYKSVSYLPAPEYGTEETFLSNSIRTLNEDCEYLVSKYDPTCTDPSQSEVIQASGRIKSLLSFVNKVREKVSEYLIEDRDLGYLNESLRDIIGLRIIIDPPKEIKDQGPQAVSDYLYTVLFDLMNKHGVLNPNQSHLENGQFKFLPVVTRYNQTKAKDLKAKKLPKAFLPYQNNITGETIEVFVPTTRIPEVDDPRVDSKIKDRNQSPNKNGYQSIHYCVVPDYSKTVETMPLPVYILPTKSDESEEYKLEYQFRTFAQHKYAELGPAAHNSGYKPTGTYHRLAVPFYIGYDSLQDTSETYYEPSKITASQHQLQKNKINLKNFGESFKMFYGYSFESFFGVPFKIFRDIFCSRDRDDILSLKKRIKQDKETNIYYAESIENDPNIVIPVFLTPYDIKHIKKILSTNDPQGLSNFFAKHFLTDSILNPSIPDNTSELEASTSASKPVQFKVYMVQNTDFQNIHLQSHTHEVSKQELQYSPAAFSNNSTLEPQESIHNDQGQQDDIREHCLDD